MSKAVTLSTSPRKQKASSLVTPSGCQSGSEWIRQDTHETCVRPVAQVDTRQLAASSWHAGSISFESETHAGQTHAQRDDWPTHASPIHSCTPVKQRPHTLHIFSANGSRERRRAVLLRSTVTSMRRNSGPSYRRQPSKYKHTRPRRSQAGAGVYAATPAQRINRPSSPEVTRPHQEVQ